MPEYFVSLLKTFYSLRPYYESDSITNCYSRTYWRTHAHTHTLIQGFYEVPKVSTQFE